MANPFRKITTADLTSMAARGGRRLDLSEYAQALTTAKPGDILSMEIDGDAKRPTIKRHIMAAAKSVGRSVKFHPTRSNSVAFTVDPPTTE